MKQRIRRLSSLGLLFVLLSGIPTGAALAQSSAVRTEAPDQTVPSQYVLTAAYPNPFNPVTSFSLTVRQRQEVQVDVYNMLGQPVKHLYSGMMDAGETRTFTFDAGELPTGIYLYRVRGKSFTAARQVTLLK